MDRRRYERDKRYAGIETDKANEGRAEEIRKAFKRQEEINEMHRKTLQLIKEGRNEEEIKCTLIGLFPELASELMNDAIEKDKNGNIITDRLDAQIKDKLERYGQNNANKIQRNHDDDGR